MCLAVPAEVISIEDDTAVCRVDRGQTTVKASLMLLPEKPELGEFLIIHAGFALRILDREEAEKSLRSMNLAVEGV
ncbi:hydantoin utilization protein B [Pseudodesulfovibrio nedwellii]|uniref:Hydantoin utilization protein B n=1 Tax=Pseudodesulfovibrio nedwellii TaxID=2973072 RepID=A0ABM8B0K4_9BACT|nr:HypC/HybG/HupF family hydrogenase formation chaperone [Pseudodesulfovibrio nedwellii]BDQ37086.1 hydantoin utilization protein B [Pseudodesulfovibrio nedwellii]